MTPVGLSDRQLDHVLRVCVPLLPVQRAAFLEELGYRLRIASPNDLSDATVDRAITAALQRLVQNPAA